MSDIPEKEATQQTVSANNHSVSVGGNVNGDVYFINGKPTSKAKDLERGYLSWLLADCRAMSMSPFSAGGRDEPGVELEAVYTALLTNVQREKNQQEKLLRDDSEKPNRLSALELVNKEKRLVLQGGPGSGKSTFVNYLALCLAGESIGHERLNLHSLTQPLPDEDGDDLKEPQNWQHGVLFPIKIVLRDFAASQFLPVTPEQATAENLWSFIEQQLQKSAKTELMDYLRERLNKADANVLLMLDGLDEVAEAEKRREQVRAVIQAFTNAHSGCRVLVTCRPYAYEKASWQLNDFSTAMLADFTPGQIRRFIDRWYSKGNLDEADAKGRAHLLKQIIFKHDGERLRALAKRPLLLTMVAHLHADKKRELPEKRCELYEEVTTLLLETWEKRRYKVDEQGQEVLVQESLTEYLRVGPDVIRFALEKVAYDVHKSQTDAQGTANITRSQLYEAFVYATGEDKDIKPVRLQEYLCDRCGILHERGNEIYTFPHRSFQEYLAACYLNRDEAELINGEGEELEFSDFVAELGRKAPDRWREVVLLAGLKAASGNSGPAWDLAEALCPEPPPKDCVTVQEIEQEDAWGARLAGQLLIEATNPAAAKRNKIKIRDNIRDWQLAIMRHSTLHARERCAAGDCLSLLGDSRFKAENNYLADDLMSGFKLIPEGSFILGSDDPEDDFILSPSPKHKYSLPCYYMAQYPVTNGQFHQFIYESSYKGFDEDFLRGIDNHPVVYVSWNDAIAYCNWLQNRLVEQANKYLASGAAQNSEVTEFWLGLRENRLHVSLPSEPEWEKAARGEHGLIYPWQGKCNPDKANYSKTEWNQTSAVGCFPTGASPFACEEMSGNVWEWTRSNEGDYPYPIKDQKLIERESLVYDGRRVLRGGAFGNNSRGVRAAIRSDLEPNDRYYGIGFRVVVSPLPLGDKTLAAETLAFL